MRVRNQFFRVISTALVSGVLLCACAKDSGKNATASEPQLTPTQYAAAWEVSNRAGLEALSKKDYETAEKTLLQALKDAEGCGMTDERVAVSLNNLASVYEEKKMYNECLPYLKRSKTIFQHDLPAGNKVLPVVLGNEARVLSELEKYPEAELAYNDAIDLQRKTKSNELADTLKGYAHVLTELKKPELAKKAQAEADSLAAKSSG